MKLITKLVFAAVTLATGISPILAQQTLQGDEKSACEAIMCLAASQRPNECTPAIQRYLTITATQPWKLLQKRRDFLSLCPKVDQAIINTVTMGDQCVPDAMNANVYNLGTMDSPMMVVSNQMPSSCPSFYQLQGRAANNYPMYVGLPERGGFWVDATGYQAALDAYNARVAAEDAAALLASQNTGSAGGL
jgi:TrbM